MNPRHITPGSQFGRWTVLGSGTKKQGHTGSGPWFYCRCTCGTERSVWGHSLVAKYGSTSCGCYQREVCAVAAKKTFTTHGHNRSRKNGHKASKEYRAWAAMIRRCTYPSEDRFPQYGGRGIKVCEKWRHSFESFLTDIGLAPSPEHSLGRVDNDGHYEPGNVEWQTAIAQARNKQTSRMLTLGEETMTIGEWSKKTGINRQTIQMRIDVRGWSVAEALSTPVRK